MFELWEAKIKESERLIKEAVLYGRLDAEALAGTYASGSSLSYTLTVGQLHTLIESAFRQGAQFERETRESQVACDYCGDPYPEGSLFDGACVVCRKNLEDFKSIWEGK
jgi:hypothetical protein